MERDENKAKHYFGLAAMMGDVQARHNVGSLEEDMGNMDRALKHYMIAVVCGDSHSLTRVREFYSNGHASKDDYTKALRSYQAYLDEIKSDQRDKAAAVCDEFRYY